MKRSDKLKALRSLLSGNPDRAQQIGQAASKPLRYEEMSDAQLMAIIEAGTGKPCPDYEAMTNEELEAIINGTNTP